MRPSMLDAMLRYLHTGVDHSIIGRFGTRAGRSLLYALSHRQVHQRCHCRRRCRRRHHH